MCFSPRSLPYSFSTWLSILSSWHFSSSSDTSKLPRVAPLSKSHPIMFPSTSARTQLLQPSLGMSIRGKRALTLSTLLLACCWVHGKAAASCRGEGTGQACYRESAASGQGYFRSMSTTSAITGLFGFFYNGFCLGRFSSVNWLW